MDRKNSTPIAIDMLSYARSRPARRLPWRWIVSTLLVVFATGSLTWYVYARSRVLMRSPIGPVDWPHVLSSPTLTRLAWQLLCDPSFAAPTRSPPTASTGQSLLVGSLPSDVQVSLLLPLTYDETVETLTISVKISNVGQQSIVVPAAAVEYQLLCLVATAEWSCYDDKPRPNLPQAPSVPIGVRVILQPVLGTASEVVVPGQTVTRRVTINAPQMTIPFNFQFCLFGSYHEFLINPDTIFDPAIIDIPTWEGIGNNKITHALFAPGVPLPSRRWEAPEPRLAPKADRP